MNKTKVEMKNDDFMHQEWKKGEKGYIDGYVFSGEQPLCVVVLGEVLIMCKFHEIKILKEITDDK